VTGVQTCALPISIKEVAVEDVAFIIAATAIREEEQLGRVVEEYMYRDNYLLGLDEDECKAIALTLWKNSKILQPRLQGLHRHMQPENAVWVDMFPTELSTNESVKKAWDAYRFMMHMVENVDTDALETFK
jgi:hypothetical protein